MITHVYGQLAKAAWNFFLTTPIAGSLLLCQLMNFHLFLGPQILTLVFSQKDNCPLTFL